MHTYRVKWVGCEGNPRCTGNFLMHTETTDKDAVYEEAQSEIESKLNFTPDSIEVAEVFGF